AAMGIALAVEAAATTRDRAGVIAGFEKIVADDGERSTFGPGAFGEAAQALHDNMAIHYAGAANLMTFEATGYLTSAPTEIWRVDHGILAHDTDLTPQETAAVVKAPAPTTVACKR